MSMLKDWTKAKLEFEKLTNKKKPSEKTMLGFRASSGIESALKTYEKTMYWDVAAKKEAAALKNLSAKVTKYTVLLKTAINDEPSETKPTMEKALKMLRTRLQRYVSKGEANLADKEARDSGNAAGQKKIDALHKRAVTDVKSAAMAVRAAAAKIKAQPTVAVYNDEMIHCDTMRRALYYVTLAREAGDQTLPNPKPYEGQIQPYHMGDKRWAKEGDDPNELVKQAIEAWKICKTIMGVYAK